MMETHIVRQIAGATLVLFLVASCGGGDANERYLDAIQKKLDGDQRGFYDDMMELAVDEPETRAGRRARTVVTGGGAELLLLAGAAMAVGAASYLVGYRVETSALQQSVQQELASLSAAQAQFFANNQRYCRTFEECDLASLSGPDSSYVFFMGDDASVSAENELLRLEAAALMESMGIEPVVTGDGFLAVAVGNIDSDSDLDVWTVDQTGGIYNVISD